MINSSLIISIIIFVVFVGIHVCWQNICGVIGNCGWCNLSFSAYVLFYLVNPILKSKYTYLVFWKFSNLKKSDQNFWTKVWYIWFILTGGQSIFCCIKTIFLHHLTFLAKTTKKRVKSVLAIESLQRWLRPKSWLTTLVGSTSGNCVWNVLDQKILLKILEKYFQGFEIWGSKWIL